MSENKTNPGRVDRDRNSIDMHEDDEVRYWWKHFGVTEPQLRAAVEHVETTAAAVRTHLDR